MLIYKEINVFSPAKMTREVLSKSLNNSNLQITARRCGHSNAKQPGGGEGAADAVDGGGDDTAGVARAFPAGEYARGRRALQRLRVADDPYRRGSPRLCAQQQGIRSVIATYLIVYQRKNLTETIGDHRREHLMQRDRYGSRMIRSLGKVLRNPAFAEIRHALRRSGERMCVRSRFAH